MTIKTFLTRSFKLYSTDGEGSSVLTLTNNHEDVPMTDVRIEMNLDDEMSTEKSSMDVGILKPGQTVEIATVTIVDKGASAQKRKIKATVSGRVDGGDVDRESLVVDSTF